MWSCRLESKGETASTCVELQTGEEGESAITCVELRTREEGEIASTCVELQTGEQGGDSQYMCGAADRRRGMSAGLTA